MDEYKLGQMEAKFAEMIWQSAPVASGELVKQCAQVFGWKKSTTYTMHKRLCQRGLFENSGGEVRVLITRLIMRRCRAHSLWRRLLTDHCRAFWQLLPGASS